MRTQFDRRLKLSYAARAALPVVVAASGVLLPALGASAVSLTYDANTGTAGVQDGTGVWNTATNNFYDGAANVPWANTTSDTAVFGAGGTIANAAAGTVTVGAVNAGTIQFSPTVTTGYTLTGGTITLGSGITSTQTLTTNVTSSIAGTNGLAFSGVGTATVSLNGANTYSGITTTGALGRLQSNSATALGASAGATATTLGTDYTSVAAGGTAVVAVSTGEAFVINGSGQSSAGALRINNATTFGSLVQLGSNSLILNNGGLATTFNGNIALGAFTLSVNNFGAVAANAMTFNGDVTGTGAVNINSSGNTILINGAKTYTGNTSVTTNTGSTGVATLGGTGSLASNLVTINGSATLAAAVTGATNGTVGTLTFGNNLTVNGVYVADITAAAGDTLAVGGALNLNTATDTLTIQGVSGLASYTLATFATRTGTFDTVNGVPAGYVLNYNANSITLDNPSLLPEPATLGAAAAGASLLLRRRRRA